MQRVFDIFFSTIALIIMSPFFIIVSILLRISGEGEIFFIQERIGLFQRKFGLIKFATMKKNSPNIGTGTLTIKDDPRILPVGKFLRKTKINELPQLINIILGDMSLIGPRPLTRQGFNKYSLESQSVIQNVTPGLSGLGSIIFRDEEGILSQKHKSIEFYSEQIAPYKSILEVWFAENKSMKIYFLLIAITIWIVIMPKSNIIWKLLKDIPPPSSTLGPFLRN